MFIVVQLPLADLRPVFKNGMGRMEKPDWKSANPQDGFLRGFGRLATRNSKSFGLIGERQFADFDNAARLRQRLRFVEPNWPSAVNAELRFRRIYYDGRLAGRLEFGFFVPDDQEFHLADHRKNLNVDPRAIARAALDLPIDVMIPGLPAQRTSIGTSGEFFGQAWLAATTQNSELAAYPPGEVYGGAVAVGPALVHIRLSNDLKADVGRDRAEAEGSNGDVFFTSSGSQAQRNNVLVQLSRGSSHGENGSERAMRVLFSHLSALTFAQSHYLHVQDELQIKDDKILLHSVNDMIKRLEKFEITTPESSNDKDFSRAIALWSDRFSGRASELTSELSAIATAINTPNPAQKGLKWMNSIFELAIKTGVEASVNAGMSIGQR